jgi:hypothetical protein
MNSNERFTSHLASQATLLAFPTSGKTGGTKRQFILAKGNCLPDISGTLCKKIRVEIPQDAGLR